MMVPRLRQVFEHGSRHGQVDSQEAELISVCIAAASVSQ